MPIQKKPGWTLLAQHCVRLPTDRPFSPFASGRIPLMLPSTEPRQEQSPAVAQPLLPEQAAISETLQIPAQRRSGALSSLAILIPLLVCLGATFTILSRHIINPGIPKRPAPALHHPQEPQQEPEREADEREEPEKMKKKDALRPEKAKKPRKRPRHKMATTEPMEDLLRQGRIIVYSSPYCPHCKSGIRLLRRLGAGPVEVREVSDTAGEPTRYHGEYKAVLKRMKFQGKPGVPTFLISGKLIVGYDSSEIRSLVQRMTPSGQASAVQQRLEPPSSLLRKGRIVVYGAPWCPACKALKGWIEGKGMRFDYREAYDGNSVRSEYYEEMAGAIKLYQMRGGEFRAGKIPVAIVDGKIYSGFGEEVKYAILRLKGMW